jgi:hypothetical protein
MPQKLKEFNHNKRISQISNCLVIILILHLLFIFMIYCTVKLSYRNPLIPKYLAFEVFAPYAEKGLIITIGLLIVMPLKFFKQNLLTIIICLILIALYYFTSFEPDFTEYQK